MHLTVMLDLDGVVADFSGPAMIQWGARNWYAENPDIRGEEAWDIPGNLGIEPTVFWGSLNTYEFWANLPVLEDGQVMVAEILGIPEVEFYFLTAPRSPGTA